MTQHTDIRDRILADIGSGALALGARLTIDELAGRYDASHMPVREALRELQGAGILETGSGRSARVRAFDPDFVQNLFEARGALEATLARRAAQRCTPGRLRELDAIEAKLEARLDEGDYTGVLRQNRLLHATINDIAGNPATVAIIDRHWLLINALWTRVGYGPERFPGVVGDHRHLLRALGRADSDAAGTLMAAHVIKAQFDLLDRMSALRSKEGQLRHAS